MVTANDVRRARIFTDLDQRACARPARSPADVSLAAYAAHEGDQCALFVLLDGRIEAVKVVDGIDRVVGKRLAGDIFGEVPIGDVQLRAHRPRS
jgi:thioredoxin reductase (NADPH)